MADKKANWRQFQKLGASGRSLTKRALKVEGVSARHAHKFVVQRWNNIRDVRRHVIGWMLLVGLLIAATALQMWWFQNSYRTEAAAAGGTYAEAAIGPIETLNPLYASSSAERSAARLLFSSLYNYDKQGGLRGDIAESMTISDDAKVYTVKIKPNVFWHDNTRLTADDIVFTIDLIRDPSTRISLEQTWRDITAEVVDERTVVFRLPARIAAFPHALTFPVLPKHILEKVESVNLRENSFSNAPVGSGPFTLRLLQTIDSGADRRVVHMGAFEHYHGGTPKLSRFQLHSYDNREVIVRALQTGEVNGAADLASGDISSVDTDRYDVDHLHSGNGVYALFNTTSPVLQDKIVREALRLAADTKQIRSKLATPAPALDLPFLPSQIRSSEVPSAPATDTKRAASLLEEAGWKQDGAVRKKDGQPLAIRLVTVKDSDFEAVVQELAAEWRKVGVMVETTLVDSSDPTQNVAQNILQPRDYDVLVYGLAIGADPDVYVYWHSSQAVRSGLNLSNYSNPISDDALAGARTRIEPELRDIKYVSFARQWLDDVPAIGLYQSNYIYVHSKRAETINQGSLVVSPQSRYADIPYWTVESEAVYKTP